MEKNLEFMIEMSHDAAGKEYSGKMKLGGKEFGYSLKIKDPEKLDDMARKRDFEGIYKNLSIDVQNSNRKSLPLSENLHTFFYALITTVVADMYNDPMARATDNLPKHSSEASRFSSGIKMKVSKQGKITSMPYVKRFLEDHGA